MAAVAELTDQLKKNLDGKKELSHDTILDIFKRLDEVQITKSILEDTKVGVIVNTYRKSSDEKVAGKSKLLLKKWKKLIEEQEQQSEKKSEKKTEKSSEKSEKSSAAANTGTPPTSSSHGDGQQNQGTPPASSQNSLSSQGGDENDLLSKYATDSSLRNKSMKLLFDGLVLAAVDEDAKFSAATIASEIESEVFKVCGEVTETDYKTKVRSLSFNLKDPKNPSLRANVISRQFSAGFLSTASAADLASEEKRKMTEELKQKAISESKIAEGGGVRTTQFRCGKCGKSDTKYSQLQTRSADEPMTTFVTCMNCGNRWKFS